MKGCEHNPNEQVRAPRPPLPMLRIVEDLSGALIVYARSHIGVAEAERVMGSMRVLPGGAVELAVPDRSYDNVETLYRPAGRHESVNAALTALRTIMRSLDVLCPHGYPTEGQ